MQYVIKISAENTAVWRLLAIDGRADRAHAAMLIAEAFDLKGGSCSFCVGGKSFCAGTAGDPQSTADLIAFDDFKLMAEDSFTFSCSSNADLVFTAVVMKAESRLYCLIPSCLVGSGALSCEKAHENLTADKVNGYMDSDDFAGVDLKQLTAKLRALGAVRKDINQSMVQAGAVPLNFKAE